MNVTAVPDRTTPRFGDLPDQLLGVLARAGRAVTIEAVRTVPDAKLTPPQFRILNFLLTAPGVSLSDVAAHLGVRLPTASVMVVKLEAEGYVERRRDPASRRRMQLALTERGHRTMLRVRESIDSRLGSAFARLGPEEQQDLLRFLPLFNRFLEQL